ncbi:entericidin A/B family lipoprotein [Zophobihabitans entericus]|uniref:Entericidin A/B family lipoprotein n=1 Tax=Zophobihabitans entericus TaxID=1635327 RepID=A0A6G9I7N4_9GAMM|nr:entericidin A/B family lipoprotein [Zophobihabitans entericus]QIQ20211.1 entericidin A/B family lipoprotein [Zophobihabitans entericus]
MKKWIAVMLCILSLSLTACNTVKGVGQDIQAGGEKLEQAAS